MKTGSILILRGALCLILAFGLGAAGSPAPPADQSSLEDHVRLVLRTRFPGSGKAPQLELAGQAFPASPWLACFYERRGFAPAWSAAGGQAVLRPGAEELMAALAKAEEDGLRPEDYRLAALRGLSAALRSRPEAGNLAELDLLLSNAFLTFAADLRNGKVNPAALYGDCALRPDPADLAAALEDALGAGRVEAGLAALAPPHRGYARLRAALGRYRDLAARGGPAPLPPGPTLRTGNRGERVAALRSRLAEAAAADADEPLPSPLGSEHLPDLFDGPLAEAVRRFQRRHGLEEDGVAGPATLAELGQRAEDHVRQIEANLERWRWMPRDFGRRHVLVNIAAFRLDAVEDGHSILDMRVIVGKPYTRTPVFSGAMETVVLNPSWNVPQSIAANEILPKARKDPSYLARHGYELLAGSRIRQRPGPQNALGRIKFLFPNRFSVYLHDTPARALFGRTVRAFSHGCIRIERPFDLAVWALTGDPRWPREAIQAALDAGRERQVPLSAKIPVHIAYWTAWVDDAGTLRLGPDVYDRDERLAPLLEGG